MDAKRRPRKKTIQQKQDLNFLENIDSWNFLMTFFISKLSINSSNLIGSVNYNYLKYQSIFVVLIHFLNQKKHFSLSLNLMLY